MDTDQFMAQMGVFNSDQLKQKSEQMKAAQMMNTDLDSIATPNLKYREVIPSSLAHQTQNTAEMFRKMGGNMEDIGQFLLPSNSKEPDRSRTAMGGPLGGPVS